MERGFGIKELNFKKPLLNEGVLVKTFKEFAGGNNSFYQPGVPFKKITHGEEKTGEGWQGGKPGQFGSNTVDNGSKIGGYHPTSKLAKVENNKTVDSFFPKKK